LRWYFTNKPAHLKSSEYGVAGKYEQKRSYPSSPPTGFEPVIATFEPRKTDPAIHHTRIRCKGKVKCILVQAVRLCTGRTAHRGSRGIALLFLDHGTRRGRGVSVTPPPLFTPRKDPVPIVLEAGWGPGPVWTGAENLAPTGIRSPDRLTRSQSLYRLRYPAHTRLL